MPRRLAQQRMTLSDLEWHRALSLRQLSFLFSMILLRFALSDSNVLTIRKWGTLWGHYGGKNSEVHEVSIYDTRRYTCIQKFFAISKNETYKSPFANLRSIGRLLAEFSDNLKLLDYNLMSSCIQLMKSVARSQSTCREPQPQSSVETSPPTHVLMLLIGLLL